jgi:hypothetical protein
MTEMEDSSQPVEKLVKRKLRWYQFSLRSLLIFVTLFAVACSWFAVKMGQAKRQREAVAKIRKAKDGYVVYDDSSRPVLFQGQNPPNTWWCKTFGEDFLCDVIKVSCEDVDPRDLPLDCFPHLRELVIDNTRGTEAGLQALEGLSYLQSLHLSSGRNIEDSAVRHLKGLISLKILNLYDTKMTDTGLSYLQDLTNIETLGLANAKITDKGLVYLLRMSHLKSLELHGCQISDEGLTCLRKFPGLQRLDLSGTKVSDQGIRDLQESIPNLEITR